MYSIAKLLSDEPKKLERLILAVLKLLATVWIANLFLGFNADLSEFSVESFFKNFKVDESIYFVLTSIGVWYLVWEMLLELLIEFIIKLFSLIGNSENTLKWYLSITNSVKTKNENIIDSKPNVLHFTESMQDEDEDYPFVVETRANQIFSVGLVSFIILLTSDLELGKWQIGLGVFLLVNFFLVSVIQRKLHDYYIENADHVRSKYYPLGQLQKVKDVINQLEPLKSQYEVNVGRKRIDLKSKSKQTFLPDEITLVPLYTYNKELGAQYVNKVETNMIDKLSKNTLSIIFSNFYHPEKRLSKIGSSIYNVFGETHSDIYKGLEELLFLLNSEYQKRFLEENLEQLDKLSTNSDEKDDVEH